MTYLCPKNKVYFVRIGQIVSNWCLSQNWNARAFLRFLELSTVRHYPPDARTRVCLYGQVLNDVVQDKTMIKMRALCSAQTFFSRFCLGSQEFNDAHKAIFLGENRFVIFLQCLKQI